MQTALRKGPLFYQKHPHFPLFFTKIPPPISFPAYGPGVIARTWTFTTFMVGKGNLG